MTTMTATSEPTVYPGWAALIQGIFSLVGMFTDQTLWGLKLISGVLGILAGLVVMQHPIWSTVLLPSVLVIFLGIGGLAERFTGAVPANFRE